MFGVLPRQQAGSQPSSGDARIAVMAPFEPLHMMTPYSALAVGSDAFVPLAVAKDTIEKRALASAGQRRKHLAALDGVVDRYEACVAGLRSDFGTALSQQKQLAAQEKRRLERELADLDDKLAAAVAGWDDLQRASTTDLGTLRAQLQLDAADAAAAAASALVRAEAELAYQTERASALESRLREAQDAAFRAGEEPARAAAALQPSDAPLAEMQAQLDQLRADNAMLSAELNELRGRLATALAPRAGELLDGADADALGSGRRPLDLGGDVAHALAPLRSAARASGMHEAGGLPVPSDPLDHSVPGLGPEPAAPPSAADGNFDGYGGEEGDEEDDRAADGLSQASGEDGTESDRGSVAAPPYPELTPSGGARPAPAASSSSEARLASSSTATARPTAEGKQPAKPNAAQATVAGASHKAAALAPAAAASSNATTTAAFTAKAKQLEATVKELRARVRTLEAAEARAAASASGGGGGGGGIDEKALKEALERSRAVLEKKWGKGAGTCIHTQTSQQHLSAL